jgi:hypothetical protein
VYLESVTRHFALQAEARCARSIHDAGYRGGRILLGLRLKQDAGQEDHPWQAQEGLLACSRPVVKGILQGKARTLTPSQVANR